MKTQRLWRGLLARVTWIYAIGALLLSSAMAVATFALAENRLLSDAESQHRSQAYDNAIDVSQRLRALPDVVTVSTPGGSDRPPEDADSPNGSAGDDGGVDGTGADTAVSADNEADDEADDDGDEDPATELEAADVADIYTPVLSDLRHPNGSRALILLSDNTSRSLTLLDREIPAKLKNAVAEEMEVAQFRFRDGAGGISYGVGVRLEGVDASYFEILPLTDLEATLGQLRVILAGVAAVASIAGAGLGYYSARVALAPLTRISTAASSIAGGDFEAKLDLHTDPALDELTTAFNEMVDAVRGRIEREQRFTSDVAHELRSPLMTLAASVEILERRQESMPEIAQQAIELLSHDLRRFQRLVEDLLEVSRMEAGGVQLQLSRFRLNEFLENVIFLSRTPHVPLRCSPVDANTSISADKRRLQQVMTNLLENADKYGGGATEVSYEVTGDWVHIVVDDNGPGVPAAQRERIFERFGRAEAGNRAEASGFGLGLSLVAEHIRLHGGSVWVSDRIDGQKGARFVVRLPLGEHIDVSEEMAS